MKNDRLENKYDSRPSTPGFVRLGLHHCLLVCCSPPPVQTPKSRGLPVARPPRDFRARKVTTITIGTHTTRQINRLAAGATAARRGPTTKSGRKTLGCQRPPPAGGIGRAVWAGRPPTRGKRLRRRARSLRARAPAGAGRKKETGAPPAVSKRVGRSHAAGFPKRGPRAASRARFSAALHCCRCWEGGRGRSKGRANAGCAGAPAAAHGPRAPRPGGRGRVCARRSAIGSAY